MNGFYQAFVQQNGSIENIFSEALFYKNDFCFLLSVWPDGYIIFTIFAHL